MTAATTTTLIVEKRRDKTALGTLVREALALPWSAARKLISRGKVRVDGELVTDPGHRVRARSEVVIHPAAPTLVAAGPAAGEGHGLSVNLERADLLHVDPHLVVFDKPAGINTVPFEEGERGALVDRLGVALHRWNMAPSNAPLFVVHRLDRETTGVLVFGRTWLAQRHLATLFRKHDIERRYVALVHGRFEGERIIDTVMLEDRGDGLRGSALGKKDAKNGRRAVTHVRPLQYLPEEGGATLVECRLETGRQHQIRVHLAEEGHPVIGDRVYIRRYPRAPIHAPRVMLHARTLGFTHPTDPEGPRLKFESPVPADFAAVAERLGYVTEAPTS